MRRLKTPAAMALLLMVVGCGGDDGAAAPAEPPTVQFEGLVVSGGLDPALITAWNDARDYPDAGLAYSFKVSTSGLREGARLELVMARNEGLFVNGEPVTRWTYRVQTTTVSSTGVSVFPPPGVDVGNWSSDDSAVPADLLCGETLVMVWARDASGTTVVASTYVLLVSDCTPGA
ncbi:hypothetical protein [Anaeromyxobacter terrae]|uniref:hypothetical protein n=1 Tax=Anaeromyxobacter terrae TaxID=2925406 RepID=UPI001F58AD78|nr:hypothetical protein [Anaeromyxobacter sp. SG22]